MFIAQDPTVDLRGQAPADVFFLVVTRNGEVLDEVEVSFSSSNVSSWEIENIPLAGGVNTLQVIGFGSHGNIVDTAAIRATSSVNWDPP